MKREELIELICEPMERSFSEQTKSRREQLRSLAKMIRIDEIANYLKDNPEVVDKWKTYADRKRDGTGYYILMEKKTKEFGFYDQDSETRTAILKSKDTELVVALFIIFDSGFYNSFFHRY
ncbi:MAG: hypothetical protein EU533_03690 [Promethearchaeota archaeon]|nr:MAG: hypothetical protein EU533_03690 [Candidatus Lokiarchaeota archaeon]